MKWTTEELRTIWEKGIEIPGYDPDEVRMDVAGAIIKFNQFSTDNMSFTQYDWGVDFILPKNKGGQLHIDNLRPLHVQNIVSRGSNYPLWNAAKTHIYDDSGKLVLINNNVSIQMNELPDEF